MTLELYRNLLLQIMLLILLQKQIRLLLLQWQWQRRFYKWCSNWWRNSHLITPLKMIHHQRKCRVVSQGGNVIRKNVSLMSNDGSIGQQCMNCVIGTHRELCGARWGYTKYDSNIIIYRLSQRGLGNAGSETAVICKKCIKACRLLNYWRNKGLIG